MVKFPHGVFIRVLAFVSEIALRINLLIHSLFLNVYYFPVRLRASGGYGGVPFGDAIRSAVSQKELVGSVSDMVPGTWNADR